MYNVALLMILANAFGIAYLKRTNNNIKLKAMSIGILLIVTLLVAINPYTTTAFAFPAHCDRDGFPSCYDMGFSGGQNNPGTSCPSGHSAAFCSGWDAGAAGAASNTNNNGIQNIGHYFLSLVSKSNGDATLFLVFVFLVMAGLLALRLRKRRKPKERRGFPEYVKQNVLRKQDHRCAHCNKLLNARDYDHKNGDRSDNRESNCQALCPNCHAMKTRRAQSKR